MKRRIALAMIVTATVLCGGQPTFSQEESETEALRLAAMFSDDMVLQREMEVPIWGWAKPGAVVRVVRDKQAPVEAKADSKGKWIVRLASMPAGGPHTLTVDSGSESITLTNVLMGDVWICSGQSNMQWPVWTDMGSGAMYAEYPFAEIANAVQSEIRLYIVPMTTSFDPEEDILVAEKPMYPQEPKEILRKWRVCSPETVPPFSAVAYSFGRALRRETQIPVGLIQTAWGGTICEAWTSADTLRKHPDFRDSVSTLKEEAENLDGLLKEYEVALAAWEKRVDLADTGFVNGEPVWDDVDADDSGWAEIDLPNLWETQGYPSLDGYVWFRKEVDVPDRWAGKDLELLFTGINDANQTWVNGVRISDFDDQPGVGKPRRYAVPGKLVKAGRNVIAVRVYDMGNTGGFNRSKGTMELRNASDRNETISLAGLWKMNIGAELKDVPGRPREPRAVKGNPNVPTVLYNAMIAPVIPYGIKGAIWYQGESNANRAYQYRSLFPGMIRDWRTKWGQGDFSFFFVQLANFQKRMPQPIEDTWAELREAQLMTLSLPKTGMAVTIDIGDAKDIHPKNKQTVGERLALAARHVAYGEDLVYSGPIYTSMTVEGNDIRLHFDHVGSGLVAQGGPPTGFSIAAADRKFVWANARIEGDTVVVYAPGVKQPKAVRYAWARNPFCNLFNEEGLPASPFRTDDWPGVTVENH